MERISWQWAKCFLHGKIKHMYMHNIQAATKVQKPGCTQSPGKLAMHTSRKAYAFLQGPKPKEAQRRTDHVREQREVLHLLADDEAERGQHGNAPMRDLRLAPAANLLD